MSKKVLINASILGDKLNGVCIYTIEVIRSLVSLLELSNIDFEIYCYDNEHLDFVQPSKIKLIALPGVTNAFFTPYRPLHRIIWNFWVLSRISKQFDLVYSLSSYGSPFIKKQIITIHDLVSLNFPNQYKFQYYYFRYIIPVLAKSCVHIIAISNFTKSEIEKYYKINSSKINVIKNGFNRKNRLLNESLNVGQSEYVIDKPFFLCVGASYEHKNIHRLIDAISLVQTDFLFIIVGCKNQYFETIKSKIEYMKLKNVILLDYVSSEYLSSLYKSAFCNIYISLYEGFGFPPLEAANYDVPTLASDIPTLKEIYNESVIYTNPYSVEDIANNISLIISQKTDLQLYKSKFPELIGQYSWEKTSMAIFQLIKKHIAEA